MFPRWIFFSAKNGRDSRAISDRATAKRTYDLGRYRSWLVDGRKFFAVVPNLLIRDVEINYFLSCNEFVIIKNTLIDNVCVGIKERALSLSTAVINIRSDETINHLDSSIIFDVLNRMFYRRRNCNRNLYT